MARYERILSLDGGGTWALIQVHALMDIFGGAAAGHDVLAQFDLVVANSGGAVVTGALACGLHLKEVASLFEDEAARRTIFQEKLPLLRALPLPRYTTSGKYDGLRAALGSAAKRAELTLEAWHAQHRELAHVMIVGFDYDTDRAAFFRSDPNSAAASRSSAAPRSATILDAVHASSNAPVQYFDAPTRMPEGARGEPGRRYWDGAIGGYNNPAMAGVVEALANGAAREKIRVISIGTGTVRRPRRPPGTSLRDARFVGAERPSCFRDVRKLASSILDDPPDAASFVAHVALGGRLPAGDESVGDGPIVRMNPVIRPTWTGTEWNWSETFPEATWLELAALEMDAIREHDVKLVRDLARAWLAGDVPNQPIRAGDRLQAEIGHDRYGDARAAATRFLPRG